MSNPTVSSINFTHSTFLHIIIEAPRILFEQSVLQDLIQGECEVPLVLRCLEDLQEPPLGVLLMLRVFVLRGCLASRDPVEEPACQGELLEVLWAVLLEFQGLIPIALSKKLVNSTSRHLRS
jgi:hypothetical protein